MRQYTSRERKQLTKIVCNQCGRILKIQNGILQEGVSEEWRVGDFSQKRMEKFTLSICAKSVMTD